MGRDFCLLAVFLLVQLAESVVKWEFGEDRQELVVLNQMSGRISPFEKVKTVSIPLPTCMEIKYVLVEVSNLISTPGVTFNRNTNTVTFTYKLIQFSMSSYDIMAKGKKSRQCSGGGGGGRYTVSGYSGGVSGYSGGGGGGQGYNNYEGGGGGGNHHYHNDNYYNYDY